MRRMNEALENQDEEEKETKKEVELMSAVFVF